MNINLVFYSMNSYFPLMLIIHKKIFGKILGKIFGEIFHEKFSVSQHFL